ncbi:hypothetical protein [Campylobacter hyointestinalis]|uniref:Excinuclease ABC subunit A n=1 Tax=Campylobacter hyointestinalis subsp. hyointestinalis TaxID=91352 RepID=A0A9W5AVA1_CAMHY|nr:hypothetical protein [Campylobacter hyointestinalis]ANE33064.1 putative membrane protein [Campylobacter hyointestinalis subsp. hyointestinalis LMG 9260]KEA43772.1 hypothetical protein CR67_08080 [Campylobacter hyointestinalis subsp. hyointestinalis]MBT0612101.1 hypothetical protein [Campylobacter hyointestinalis subsp. hyointestinalis]MDY2998496.1 hypothetical protein [Campylobacter hyointestinalis]PPB71676.1 hypothetical protein CDQ79_08045 [Campylobacter hyointestinalis subsp. hyointestin
MRFLLLLFISLPIFASNLLTYNIYERGDRVDIMLSFDSAYDGSLKQQSGNGVTDLLLSDLVIDNDIDKSINSDIIQNLFITTTADKTATKVELKWNEPISITASKTADKFGLRIRVAKLNQAIKTVIPPNIKTKDSTNASYDIDSKYITVIIILFVLLIVLFFVKKMIMKQKIAANSPFTVSKGTPTKKQQPVKNSFVPVGDGVEVLYEKSLDETNKVALLSFEGKRYLVLFGSSNVLLDKFGEDKIKDEEDFEVFFEENRQKLGRYLEDRRNSLNSYKDMMSKD